MTELPILSKQSSSIRSTHALRLAWGKLRRQYLLLFRPNYIRLMQTSRIGSCNGCGVCCRLAWRCWYHRTSGETEPEGCSRYINRFVSCRLFPVDHRDLRDRDLLSPDVPCGFSFIAVEETARTVTDQGPAFAWIRSTHAWRRCTNQRQKK